MRVLCLLILLASPLSAQDRVIAAIGQVGEGNKDTLILEVNAQDPSLLDILVVTREDYSWSSPTRTVRYESVLFLGPNNAPGLFIRNNGTILLEGLGCFACGRYHFDQSMVLQSVDGDWRVIGYTENIVDRTAPWRAGTCDVNLLTGKAEIQLAEQPATFVKSIDGPLPLAELTDDFDPDICSLIHLSEEEWEPYKPAEWEE